MQLIDLIRQGDVSAFKELFTDFFPVLCCFAEKYVSDEAISKDIAQEALLKYWENRANFNNIYKVKSYLYVVTKNMALNILKRNKKSIGIDYREINTPDSDNDVLYDHIIEHEVMLLVHKAVSSLPNRMREIIKLSMEGYQNKDIADTLNIAEGTVHTLKKQAYKKLKKTLGSNFCYILLL